MSVWNAKKPKKSGSVATLIINDGVKNMELSDQEENNVLVSVVTNTGSLCVFRVVLKKMLESTIEPFVRVSIEDSNESSIPFTTSRMMKNSGKDRWSVAPNYLNIKLFRISSCWISLI